jgi:hypothetical protein
MIGSFWVGGEVKRLTNVALIGLVALGLSIPAGLEAKDLSYLEAQKRSHPYRASGLVRRPKAVRPTH